MGKSAGNHKLHLHALREVSDALVVRQSEFLYHTEEIFAAPVLVKRLELSVDKLCVQVLREIKAVEYNAEALLYSYGIGDAVKPENADLTAVDLRHIENGADSGSLAGAVLTDKPHYVAFRKCERYIFQREIPIRLVKILNFKNILHNYSCSPFINFFSASMISSSYSPALRPLVTAFSRPSSIS